MKPLLLATLLLLHGYAGTRPQPPSADWLIGGWLEMSGGSKYPLACESDLPIEYGTDGNYALLEEIGTWRLDNDVLTEIATEATEAADPAEVAIGRTYVSTIEKLSDDRFLKRLPDGQVLEFRRCPEIR